VKSKKKVLLLAAIGMTTLASAALLGVYFLPNWIPSHSNTEQSTVGTVVEQIEDNEVPLAAPTSFDAYTAGDTVQLSYLTQPTKRVKPTIQQEEIQPTTDDPAPAEPTHEEPAPEEPAPDEPAPEEPAPEEPAPEESAPEEPAPEEPTPEDPAPEEPAPEEPARAVKPSDITDVNAMAEYLYLAGCEFWATEKDFCGTTTRPVSTRVSDKIGGGTAVDCPGGDTVRIDSNGVSHDSYAIADHFREYVDMPDLQYFKLYLSDKDYTEQQYGAREEVIGAFYQYGSERATYLPEEQE
jgi:outer membrane biosynthesis protein TonB